MSSSSPASLLDVDLQPGKPPMLRAEAAGDAPSWAAEHRDALRAVVAEHGSVLVRGLGLRDAAETGAVFQRLATGLMTEKEAFAPRRDLLRRRVLLVEVAAEPADVHAPRTELRARVPRPDAVRVPHRAHRRRGDRGGRLADRARRAARRAGRAVRAGGLAAHPQLQRGDRGVRRRGVRHRGPWRRRELLPRQRDRVRVATRRRAAHQAAPQRRGASPGHRPALLVQPDRVPQRVDDRPRGARVPGGRLRRRRAAVQHPLRQRRPDRRGRRAAAQQRLRGQHRTRAVAGRRPDARRQHPHRAQQGALRGTARSARRDGRRGAAWPTARRPSR